MALVLIPASILFAVAPMVTLLLLVWWLDRYNRQPVWLFGLTFLWGGIGGVLIALIGNMLLDFTLSPIAALADQAARSDGALQLAVGPVIVAPLVEEPAKAAFLAFVIWNRRIESTVDGFVYGAAAGLGFGMTENALYFITNAPPTAALLGDWMEMVYIRTGFSAVMHMTSTAIVGAALGWARLRGWFANGFALFGGFALAMGIHAMWNGLITAEQVLQTGGALMMADMIALPIIVLLAFLAFQLSLLDASLKIRRELRAEAEEGTLPTDHADRMSRWLSRHSRRWVPAGVDHRRYVQAATTLALRRHQARKAKGPRGEFYRDDVSRLRRQVRLMLEHSADD